jgi:hypothetical protein
MVAAASRALSGRIASAVEGDAARAFRRGRPPTRRLLGRDIRGRVGPELSARRAAWARLAGPARVRSTSADRLEQAVRSIVRSWAPQGSTATKGRTRGQSHRQSPLQVNHLHRPATTSRAGPPRGPQTGTEASRPHHRWGHGPRVPRVPKCWGNRPPRTLWTLTRAVPVRHRACPRRTVPTPSRVSARRHSFSTARPGSRWHRAAHPHRRRRTADRRCCPCWPTGPLQA